jgi:1-acyl-sn-glycerol-3-phosphate acyltransferase
LAAVLRQTSVAIFPEGTSSDGGALLPFKGAPFAAALAAPVPVVSWVLAYVALDGRAFSRTNHQMICWYGDMGFVGSLWRTVQLGSIGVRMVADQAVPPNGDRRTVAAAWHERMQEIYVHSLGSCGSLDHGGEQG